MPHIHVANVACGFHASDFNHMATTVRLAKKHGVKVGAHPSLPDRQGFGRREMKIGREEMANCLIYQIGALKGFLDAEGMALNHIKPHGSLYGMAARQEDIAHASRRGGCLQVRLRHHNSPRDHLPARGTASSPSTIRSRLHRRKADDHHSRSPCGRSARRPSAACGPSRGQTASVTARTFGPRRFDRVHSYTAERGRRRRRGGRGVRPSRCRLTPAR